MDSVCLYKLKIVLETLLSLDTFVHMSFQRLLNDTCL